MTNYEKQRAIMLQEFGYIIAYRYGVGNRYSCYTYGVQVFHGTTEDSLAMLDYVKNKSPDQDWQIYKISDTEEMEE